MGITQTIDVVKRQALYIIAAMALVLAIVLPALVSAATVTERSVELSSSSKKATDVTYRVNFTASSTGAAGAFVVQFCKTTPLIGEDCDVPAGFSAAAAATSTSGATIANATANKVIVTDTIANSEQVSVALDHITNPDDAGTIYARVVTYGDATDAGTYSTDGKNLGTNPIDQGSVAMSITDTVGVSGAVLETMTFCVSGGQDAAHPEVNPITASCGGTLTAPTLKLGKDTNGVIALDSDAVYSGTIYTQLSTNAVGGAVVNLKSGTVCGGLHRAGAAANLCDIAAAGASGDVAQSEAKFGVKTGPLDSTSDTTQNGTIQPAGSYDNTHYRLNYDNTNSAGITSTYGDPIFNTNAGPASNKNMPLTFGASVANNTPAGNYSADLSLVATGKF